MEKYMGNLRIILCCNSTSKIIAPIRSRCLLLRVAAPEPEDIATILQKVSIKEGVTLPESLAFRIGEKSDRNLRKALLILEAAAMSNSITNTGTLNSTLNEKQDLPLADWETFIHQVTMMMVSDQSIERYCQGGDLWA